MFNYPFIRRVLMARILVVDDEIYIRRLYKEEFERDGYEVIPAADADEALRAMTAKEPDLVILDIELEKESGLQLLNRIRQDFRECAVILNTAYSTYKSDFQTWLADAYIMKSSDLNPLKEKVKDLLVKGPCGHEQ
jgi:DNA-binding NtrC family response regulator